MKKIASTSFAISLSKAESAEFMSCAKNACRKARLSDGLQMLFGKPRQPADIYGAVVSLNRVQQCLGDVMLLRNLLRASFRSREIAFRMRKPALLVWYEYRVSNHSDIPDA